LFKESITGKKCREGPGVSKRTGEGRNEQKAEIIKRTIRKAGEIKPRRERT